MGSGLWSPKESGLIGREEFADAPRSNFAKISSKDFGRCVPAVFRGLSTAMDVTIGMPIQKGAGKRAFNVTVILLAVGLSRYCCRIDSLIGRFAPSGCRLSSTSGRGSKPKVWTLRPASWRPVASNERGVP